MNNGLQLKSRDYVQTPEGKKYFNEQHFTEAARKYNIATRGLSLGRDASWKRLLINSLPALETPVCLDLACGTGDLAFALAEKYPEGSVQGMDLTEAMLDLAQKKNSYKNLSFFQGDICELNLEQDSVDIITGGYAIRNTPDLTSALKGIRRILKPGGTAAFLDFSKPTGKTAQIIQYWTLKLWGSFWGLILHGNPEVHGYISASLKTYPDHKNLVNLFEDTGFQVIARKPLFLGMMELSILQKPESSS